jgi:hypothetical protein
VTWTEVAAQSGLGNCARLAAALLTSIQAIGAELSDPAAARQLAEYLTGGRVWMPVEGRFEPLLRGAFLDAFERAGCREMVYVPEFPGADPVERLEVAALRAGRAAFPAAAGTLAAPDARFLFTVDWESFFTLFYGPRALVEQVARRNNLEGFFCTPTTEHLWFHYAMGCATVTVTPEVWRAEKA